MRCALYLRVSSKKQLDGVSLDDQEHLGRTHAERMGWTVTHVFKEMGQSAFKEDLRKRAAFQQLLDEAQRRSFDVVLVYKLNRFARNVPAQYQAAAELERYGVRIASVTEPVERQTASGRATFGMLAVMAQLQSDQLSEKMRDTRLAEARQGRLVGPVPVGYRRDDLGCVVPSSGAEAVREAFRLYATGEYSVQRITAALNEAGHVMPDGGPFKVTGVEEMLKSPIYAGYVICGDKTFPAKHEPLIDQETWDRTREVQVERGRRRTGPPKRHDPLLAGFMVCPGCGASMWHNLSGSKRYYRCSAYTTQGSPPTPGLACLGHRAYAEPVEQATMAWVAGLALTPDLLSQAQGMMSAPKRRVARPVDIDQSLKRLARAYGDGGLTDEEYEVRRSALLAQQQEDEAGSDRPEELATVLELLKNLPTLLREATNAERRLVLRELVTEVYGRGDEVMALRPTRLADGLFQAAAGRSEWLKNVQEWAGWAPDPRDDTLFTFLLPRRLAA